jgi:glycosyltransferase involved in cell wall biosynthesis
LEVARPEIHFLVLGRGEDEERLKARAAGLGNLTFEGFVDNVADYISSFDLFVFPSRHEGLGSILLDAMRLQVPIVASAVGGIPDLVTGGKDGVLIPPGDAAALHEAILDLHAHPQKRQELVAAATATVARYSPSAMANAYAHLYAEAGVAGPD